MKKQSKVVNRPRSATTTNTDTVTEVSKVSMTMVGVFATVVGLWSLACIVGGIVSSGGLGQLFSAWFSAVSGG